MSEFQDEQQVYRRLGGMFEDALADERAGALLRAVGCVVQLDLRRPQATITLRLDGEGDTGVDVGTTQAKPDVVLTMEADTAHRLWAAELPLHTALSKGLVRAKGPVAKILQLVPVIGPAKPLYEARIAAPDEPAAV
ncbi:MAG: SCP2 sterol-binding domain-containing protein, partial [Solirubrobacteraceae bacterium]|nr:SCP2 sterol-binding domain-containing protein [Solirubrobacteraceae bacterium]